MYGFCPYSGDHSGWRRTGAAAAAATRDTTSRYHFSSSADNTTTKHERKQEQEPEQGKLCPTEEEVSTADSSEVETMCTLLLVVAL